MADNGDAMAGDLEDGEISGSGSDTDMGATAAAPLSRPRVPPAFSGQSFQNRAAAQPPAAAYRSAGKTAESSDSDQDSSDEDASVWAQKASESVQRSAASCLHHRPTCADTPARPQRSGRPQGEQHLGLRGPGAVPGRHHRRAGYIRHGGWGQHVQQERGDL